MPALFPLFVEAQLVAQRGPPCEVPLMQLLHGRRPVQGGVGECIPTAAGRSDRGLQALQFSESFGAACTLETQGDG
nr:hypothetical protein [Stenotrophomonas sp.]